MSYPIYIVEFKPQKFVIVFENEKQDIQHTEFWEQTVARVTAKYLGVPRSELLNLPYCQRRARIINQIVFYGEDQTPALLDQIMTAVDESGLVWRFDEHEARLPMDVAMMKAIVPSPQ